MQARRATAVSHLIMDSLVAHGLFSHLVATATLLVVL